PIPIGSTRHGSRARPFGFILCGRQALLRLLAREKPLPASRALLAALALRASLRLLLRCAPFAWRPHRTNAARAAYWNRFLVSWEFALISERPIHRKTGSNSIGIQTISAA